MKNLWISIIPSLLLYFVLLVFLGCITVKKVKGFLILDIFFIFFIMVCLKGSIPYFKDLSQEELISFTGKYTTYTKVGNSPPTTSHNTFVDENGKEDYLIISKFLFSQYGLKKGNTYHITYYKNSHVVCSVELCDGTEYCEVCRENLLD